MTQTNQTPGSGEGTRPTTDGAVDNIGAGEKFTSKRNAAGEEISGGPAASERMADRRKSIEATANDDSAPGGVKEDLTPDPNREHVKPQE